MAYVFAPSKGDTSGGMWRSLGPFTADPPDIYRFYVYTISIGNGNGIDNENGSRGWDLLLISSSKPG